MKKIGFLIFLGVGLVLLSCNNDTEADTNTTQSSISDEQKDAYIKNGKSIAMATFVTLSTELGKALEEGGVAKAVNVCNLAASPLVDSLSRTFKADIRRTSFKVRNPNNKATPEEEKILKSYTRELDSGNELKAKVVEVNGMVSFYAPIMIQPLCLNCHGKVGETLKEEDHTLIKSLYPQDQAFGYDSGDFRGIWSIKFEK